jgi:hypothetical protein
MGKRCTSVAHHMSSHTQAVKLTDIFEGQRKSGVGSSHKQGYRAGAPCHLARLMPTIFVFCYFSGDAVFQGDGSRLQEYDGY